MDAEVRRQSRARQAPKPSFSAQSVWRKNGIVVLAIYALFSNSIITKSLITALETALDRFRDHLRDSSVVSTATATTAVRWCRWYMALLEAVALPSTVP